MNVQQLVDRRFIGEVREAIWQAHRANNPAFCLSDDMTEQRRSDNDFRVRVLKQIEIEVRYDGWSNPSLSETDLWQQASKASVGRFHPQALMDRRPS